MESAENNSAQISSRHFIKCLIGVQFLFSTASRTAIDVVSDNSEEAEKDLKKPNGEGLIFVCNSKTKSC